MPAFKLGILGSFMVAVITSFVLAISRLDSAFSIAYFAGWVATGICLYADGRLSHSYGWRAKLPAKTAIICFGLTIIASAILASQAVMRPELFRADMGVLFLGSVAVTAALTCADNHVRPRVTRR